MKFNKKKFNVIVTLLILIISLSIIAPTMLNAEVPGAEQEDVFTPETYEPEVRPEGTQTYKFKTASAALKQGLSSLDEQGGYGSKVVGYGSFSAAGFVNVGIDIDVNKYINPSEDIEFVNMHLITSGLDFLRMRSENTMMKIGSGQYLSYDSGTMNETDQTRALYPTRDEFINKYGKIHTDKFLDFQPSSILSYRIESMDKYQKVTMKIKQSEAESIVGCLTNAIRIDLKYKVLAPADVVFYIDHYGNLISAQIMAQTELKISYGPFSVVLSGAFNVQEKFYPVNNSEIVNYYNEKLEQYPILALDIAGNKIR